MNYVVESCKYHQHNNNREADAKADFLSAFRQWTPARRLDRVEQKVTSVEQRNREQIEEADRHRQHGGEVNQRRKTHGRNLSGYLRDPNRAAKLVGLQRTSKRLG